MHDRKERKDEKKNAKTVPLARGAMCLAPGQVGKLENCHGGLDLGQGACRSLTMGIIRLCACKTKNLKKG